MIGLCFTHDVSLVSAKCMFVTDSRHVYASFTLRSWSTRNMLMTDAQYSHGRCNVLRTESRYAHVRFTMRPWPTLDMLMIDLQHFHDRRLC